MGKISSQAMTIVTIIERYLINAEEERKQATCMFDAIYGSAKLITIQNLLREILDYLEE